jgi:NAD(P)-dependent dehydrogenase (short-subunit alcohol dehydrogenase family)
MERKTLLLTGAFGGLGLTITDEFSANGWNVIATDLENKIPEKQPADELIRVVAMDVRSDESVTAASRLLANEKLDLIINNAGIDGYMPLCEAPVDQFKEVFEVNVFGSYRVNRAFLPNLKTGARIIHVSSESVKINAPFMVYPISKQALEGYCRTLRQELRFLGIDVTMVRPGAIDTPFVENVANIRNPVAGSRLSEPFDRFAGQAYRQIGKKAEPAVVASFIYRIALRKRTRLVYPINNDPRLSVAGMLPFSVLERMFYKRLK